MACIGRGLVVNGRNDDGKMNAVERLKRTAVLFLLEELWTIVTQFQLETCVADDLAKLGWRRQKANQVGRLEKASRWWHGGLGKQKPCCKPSLATEHMQPSR